MGWDHGIVYLQGLCKLLDNSKKEGKLLLTLTKIIYGKAHELEGPNKGKVAT